MANIHCGTILILAFVILSSCEKEINVDLNESAPRIVIEGVVDNGPGPYNVRITQSVNYSASNDYPAVSNAVVIITDKTTNITDTLQESQPGTYTSHLTEGISGHTYHLQVLVQGVEYTATSTIPQPVLLDSISFAVDDFFDINSISVIPNFQDPLDQANYYLFTQYVNGRRIKNIYVFDDRLSDGKYISQELFADSAYVSAGDSVMIEMNCLDKSVYTYFSILQQVGEDGFQSVTPSNPNSNISNNALGYFSAQTSQRKHAFAH